MSMESKQAQVHKTEVDAPYEVGEWANANHDADVPKRRWKSRGWKSTVRLGFVGALAVFVLNLALLI